MRSPVVELLADLTAALDSARVPWFLFGAQAAILYGAARLTADVDVTVQFPEGSSADTLVHLMEESGFERRFDDPDFIAARTKDLDDVTSILAASQDNFDTSYVLTTLEELERALGQSDLVPLFQSARDAARRE